jgi:hypothetical protein
MAIDANTPIACGDSRFLLFLFAGELHLSISTWDGNVAGQISAQASQLNRC